ncbi:YSHH motif [Thraustotheca clavata]|uniref:YSHH motif n=1 Tax=Thraustotheca clavata TaxID=74557 RepID=A0A1V9ZWL6_9STRA|nr:YSHH motif [Thraustotheca clavata]
MVGGVATFELYQAAQEILQEIQDDSIVNLPPPSEIRPIVNPVLGRRAIYFHHIIATSKRRVVLDWAKELGLGGFSKIGWPGVIIAEGQEPCVVEYVRRLQHLRWKQMVVRGEQVESNSNAPRLLPVPFTELRDMSVLAQECKQAGVSELFLTTMKIYR